MRRWAKHSNARHFTPIALSILLLAASILKFWFETRYPQLPLRSWVDNPAVAYSTIAFEAVLGLLLLSDLWPSPTWCAAVTVFGLFAIAIVTATETLQGKSSCGCFGAVQIRPIYTMSLDLVAEVPSFPSPTQRWHAYHGTSGVGHVYQGRLKAFPVQGARHLRAYRSEEQRGRPAAAGSI